ncbi:hypothetical protein Y027_5905 [Burkholderia pseudomallei TSV5]|nr:hypothetical protein Y025_5802 [Burkholderia pseudomallei TSV32]KGX48893.1 hypothetical protein Y027_5905 [Burkholderia pseudomallei TSV5]
MNRSSYFVMKKPPRVRSMSNSWGSVHSAPVFVLMPF